MILKFLVFLLPLTTVLSQMVGGRQNLDINNEDVQKLAWKGAKYVNAMSNSYHQYIPVKVTKADSQVVAGVLYHLEIVLGQSSCTNMVALADTAVAANKCQLTKDAKMQKCQIEIWQKPWMNFEQITNKGCTDYADNEADLSKTNKKIGRVQLLKADGTTDSIANLSEDQKLTWNLFQDFIRVHNKSYTGGKTEYIRRFKIFHRNTKIIQNMQKNEQGTAKYGVTQFADMTPSEFRRKVLIPDWKDTGYPTRLAEIPNDPIPDNFDWRDHGAVTPVKNQGMCGSCWAFSVTGNVEGQWAVKNKKLISLSEQELVDCDKLDSGCNGGLPANAYKEIMRIGGLESEKDYPYDGKDESCSLNRTEIEVYINDSVKLPEDEAQMASWLYKNGPISIGINAMAMQFYWGGIAHPWRIFCSPSNLNHGVLIVGYGVKGTKPYWIVKNSWGSWWGEKGYYLVYRGDGVCGLNKMATSAIVDQKSSIN